MDISEDIEYQELLEQYIRKREDEYGDGWATSWGAIRNQSTNFMRVMYQLHGRDFAIEKLKTLISK